MSRGSPAAPVDIATTASLSPEGERTRARLPSIMKRRLDLHEKRHLLHPDDEVFEETFVLDPLSPLPPERRPSHKQSEDVFVEPEHKKRRRRGRRRSGSFTGGVWPRKGVRSLLGYAIPPPNVHSTDWRDMLAITETQDSAREKGSEANSRKVSEPHAEVFPPLPPLFSQMRFSESDLSLNRAHWITETFTRRECAKFVPTNKYPEKCGCGRLRSAHIDIPSLTSSFLNHRGGDLLNKRRDPCSDQNAAEENEAPRHRVGSWFH
ncbi:hypothetical protein NECAME_01628 [Necator americanus]|uniref:Uncharacterized protein n=1 Tax=Necator americanus TaxID=51031 RepID=W2TRI3_NECAM|nr:hypothetical protein NECAME_01628 [Necator americanus]ETN84403.1 hypothetical protein NECAME_01628 [Necator americanus]